MTVLALTSSRGSPGVTSLALGLSIAVGRRPTSTPPVLVEADAEGGVLALRYDLPPEPSLATVAGEMGRAGSSTQPGQHPLDRHLLDLGGVHLLAGSPDPLITQWALRRAGDTLGQAFADVPGHVIIDLGRLGTASDAMVLARAADTVAIVARPTADEVQSLLFTARALRTAGCTPALVLIGDEPFNPLEVAEVTDLPLVGVVADDARTAPALAGGSHSERRFHRSMLWRSIEALADRLLLPTALPAPAPPPAPVPAPAPHPAPTAAPAPVAAPVPFSAPAPGPAPAPPPQAPAPTPVSASVPAPVSPSAQAAVSPPTPASVSTPPLPPPTHSLPQPPVQPDMPPMPPPASRQEPKGHGGPTG